MTDGHTRRKTRAGKVCGALIFTLLLVLFLAVKFDFYYDLNDDTMIKDILSGAYTGTPSGYCIQMLYPLSWVLALLYRAIPAVPWYGLFLCVCQFGVIFAVAVRLMNLAKSLRIGLFALVAQGLLVTGLFLRELVIIQYSVTSGICMAGAVFLFVTAPRVGKVSLFFRKNLLPLLFVIVAFMIRTEVCMMLFPFLLLAGLAKWGSEEKIFTGTNIRKYCLLIGAALLGMMIVYSVNLLAYRDSEWDNFLKFFQARTMLYDFYGLPDYDTNKSFFESIGLSQESYTLLENYNFALDDSIDTWSLEAIVEYQELLAKEGYGLHDTFGFVSKNSLKEAVWMYRNQIQKDVWFIVSLLRHGIGKGNVEWSSPARLRFAVAVVYMVYIFIGIIAVKGRKKADAIWKIMLLVVIRSSLWLYLYMVDRVVDRVAVPLLMVEFVTLLGFVIESAQRFSETQKENTLKKSTIAIWYGILALCIVVALMGNIHVLETEYEKRTQADARWNVLMEYCREHRINYYVIDVHSSTSYANAPYSEKIFENVNDSYKNFDICGGWAAKSPLTKKKLERMGFRDVQSGLYSKNKTGKGSAFFVTASGKEIEWLVAYYKKRGLNVETVCVDQIQTKELETVFDVYRVQPIP